MHYCEERGSKRGIRLARHSAIGFSECMYANLSVSTSVGRNNGEKKEEEEEGKQKR